MSVPLCVNGLDKSKVMAPTLVVQDSAREWEGERDSRLGEKQTEKLFHVGSENSPEEDEIEIWDGIEICEAEEVK